jgi:hypothetical protein
MPWSRPFDDPDAAARTLVDLANAAEAAQDAAKYIQKLPNRRSRSGRLRSKRYF